MLKVADAHAFTSGYCGSAESTGIIGNNGTGNYGHSFYYDTNTVGVSIQWSLKSGVLTLTGSGKATNTGNTVGTFVHMNDSSKTRNLDTLPFNGNPYIKTVVIDAEIEHLNSLIGYLPNLETIILLGGDTGYYLEHVPNLKTVIIGANLITKTGETRPFGYTYYTSGKAVFDINCFVLTDELLTDEYLE